MYDDHDATSRTLALLAPGLSTRFPELLSLCERTDWVIDPVADDRLYAPIGPGHSMSSIAAAFAQLRILLGLERLGELRAIWLVPFATPAEQAALLLAAQPIERLANMEPNAAFLAKVETAA
jgi:hypothetical protein